ncbi:MAG TPA: tetratricopeptide repeat protein [Candidatus Ozemobacteraceae bacterium]|nr:tetratricopeptide repeat protein [Candidatus Ozemobacteraceae bacterium]
MSRFKWLEFDKPNAVPPTAGPATPGADADAVAGVDMTDARQVLKLADDAYRLLEYEKALRLYSKSLNIDPNIEEAWAGQLRCLLDLHENPEALTWAVKAQKLFPKNPDIQSARALALARQGKLTDAIAFSDGAMRYDRHGWFTWVARGEILALAGSGNAEFCMVKAMEGIRGADWLITLKIGQAYAAAGLTEKALPLYRKVLAVQADLAEVWYELARLQLELASVADARDSIGRALRLRPDNRVYLEFQGKALRVGPADQVLIWLKNFTKRWFGR